MDSKEIRILLIEDNAADAEWVKRALREKGRFRLEWAESLSKGLELLERGGFDVILLDMKLPDGSGLELFDKVHNRAAHLPIVILTGYLHEEQMALQALERGAQDFLLKGKIDVAALTRSLRYSIERHQIEEALTKAKSELQAKVRELESLNKIMIDREERILELKEENKQLKKVLETTRPKDEHR